MELVGTISGITVNPITKQGCISFDIEDFAQAVNEYEHIKDKRLRISVKQYRAKRSLSANAYFWILIGEVAKALHTDAEALHRKYVYEHPYVWLDENGKPVGIVLTDKVNVDNALPGYWKRYGKQRDNLIQYIRIKGTSDMDSQEFSIVIDDLVQEAKELGIETATPDELERMKQYEQTIMEHPNGRP